MRRKMRNKLDHRRNNRPQVEAFWDSQRRICLMVDKLDGGIVKFISMDIADGFQVSETFEQSFYQRYSEISGFPVDKVAQLYVNYATAVGASEDVVMYLERIVSITNEDKEKMLSRLISLPKKVAKEVEKAVVRSRRKAKKPVAAPPVDGAEYKSASQMFQDLIMSGKLTDNEIFEQVKEAFGLDEKKRGYVNWYRNNLKKKGENPPEAR